LLDAVCSLALPTLHRHNNIKQSALDHGRYRHD
jgi:hypothetical protein